MVSAIPWTTVFQTPLVFVAVNVNTIMMVMEFVTRRRTNLKQNVSTRIGTVKKQNPAISMITGFYEI